MLFLAKLTNQEKENSFLLKIKSNQPPPSSPLLSDKTIELGHHILKAHIYKNISKQRGYSSRDMQAYWMALSADNLNAALVCHRNLFSPNVKVSYCYTRPKKVPV